MKSPLIDHISSVVVDGVSLWRISVVDRSVGVSPVSLRNVIGLVGLAVASTISVGCDLSAGLHDVVAHACRDSLPSSAHGDVRLALRVSNRADGLGGSHGCGSVRRALEVHWRYGVLRGQSLLDLSGLNRESAEGGSLVEHRRRGGGLDGSGRGSLDVGPVLLHVVQLVLLAVVGELRGRQVGGLGGCWHRIGVEQLRLLLLEVIHG